MIVIEGPRNNGKTTSAMEAVQSDCEQGLNFAWIRNQQQQTEAALTNFVQRFEGVGYKGAVKSGIVKDGTDRICGNFVSLNGARKTRSGVIFNDKRLDIKTDLVIYDEFNELGANLDDLLQKLVMTIASIQRDNENCLFVCIGNRDTPQNRLTHALGLKPYNDFKQTKIEVIENEFGLCVVYRIGNDDFKTFQPPRSIYGFLAALDENTSRFIHGAGYLEDGDYNVLSYRRWIAPTFRPIVRLIIGGVGYTLGQFEHYDLGSKWALCKNSPFTDFELALDSWSDLLVRNSVRVSNEGMLELYARLIFEGYKSRELFFDEFETIDEIKSFIKIFNI